MAVIYPGQVFPGYIAPQRYVHGPVRFEYKGMFPASRARYFRDLNATKTEEEGEAVICNAMKAVLVSWNLTYPSTHPKAEKAGKPVPITIEALANEVMTHVRNRMMNIITWGTESDSDPERPVEEVLKDVELRATMIREEKTLDQMMAEADSALVGNSSGVPDSSLSTQGSHE